MTWYEHGLAVDLAAASYPFEALIMAAMLKANTTDLARLRSLWPALGNEIQAHEHIERPIVDPCAGLKVGDTLPDEHKGMCKGMCPGTTLGPRPFGCTRAPGHPGQHIATVPGNKIVAVWPEDGAL